MSRLTRRQFLQSGLWLAGGALLPPLAGPHAPHTRAASAARWFELPGTPFRARATGRSNPIVVENQKPGHVDWRPARYQYDILGFASATSVDPGGQLDFFVDTSAVAFDLHVYRLGYYGGAGGRRVAEFNALPGIAQPEPWREAETGLASCANWSASHFLHIPSDWVSGIYLGKLTRRDTGGEGAIVFVVRDEARRADLLCQQPVATYHAYNNFGGKSLYDNGSDECATTSQASRAVKVSFNRPYNAPLEDASQLLRVDYPLLYWLEAQGYDLAYCTNLDVHAWGQPGARNRLLDHRAFVSMGHDEYWSGPMRAAVTAARDAGVHLVFFGANNCYWRVRFEPDPLTGQPDRTLVCYKNTEGGPADPSGEHTGTWRDAQGANDPEANLLGVQYIGDNDGAYFPLRFAAEHTRDRAFRFTGLQQLPEDTFAEVGRELMGWEWDAALAPEAVTVLAASPVCGALLTDAGNFEKRRLRTAQAHTTRYTAPSGAQVFSTGTVQWSWGLALREPDLRVQQITCNVLADMRLLPATPDEGLRLDTDPLAASPPPAFKRLNESAEPVFTHLSVHPADTGLTVHWECDREARAQVWLGHSAEWVNEAQGVSEAPARSGQFTVKGLNPGERYFVRLAAWARADRVSFSETQMAETLLPRSLAGVKRAAGDLADPLMCVARPTVRWARANVWASALTGAVATGLVGLGAWRWVSRRARARPPVAVVVEPHDTKDEPALDEEHPPSLSPD